MMEQEKYLTPWVMPRWALEGFCDLILRSPDFQNNVYSITDIREHNPTHYLVVTQGYNKALDFILKRYLMNLYNVDEQIRADPHLTGL